MSASLAKSARHRSAWRAWASCLRRAASAREGLVGAKGGRQIRSGFGLGEILGDQRRVDPVGLGAQTASLAKGEDPVGVELHVTDACLSESPTQRPFVTAGRLHGDQRRPGSRDPGRQRLRRVGDTLEAGCSRPANIDPSFRNIDADKTFAAIALHCAPRQTQKTWSARRIAYGRQSPDYRSRVRPRRRRVRDGHGLSRPFHDRRARRRPHPYQDRPLHNAIHAAPSQDESDIVPWAARL
jgi:hypothetical protein